MYRMILPISKDPAIQRHASSVACPGRALHTHELTLSANAQEPGICTGRCLPGRSQPKELD